MAPDLDHIVGRRLPSNMRLQVSVAPGTMRPAPPSRRSGNREAFVRSGV
jgi:hypothetical protein